MRGTDSAPGSSDQHLSCCKSRTLICNTPTLGLRKYRLPPVNPQTHDRAPQPPPLSLLKLLLSHNVSVFKLLLCAATNTIISSVPRHRVSLCADVQLSSQTKPQWLLTDGARTHTHTGAHSTSGMLSRVALCWAHRQRGAQELCGCVCAFVCACVGVCLFVCARVCLCTCVSVFVHVCACAHLCVGACMCVCALQCVHVCIATVCMCAHV